MIHELSEQNPTIFESKNSPLLSPPENDCTFYWREILSEYYERLIAVSRNNMYRGRWSNVDPGCRIL